MNPYKILILCLLSSCTEDKRYNTVKTIFENKCSGCHNQNNPTRNWLNPKLAWSRREAIFHEVLLETMPPKNSSVVLTKDERRTLLEWAVQ